MSDEFKSTFVYVVYIRTTPDALWRALTDLDTVPKYWFGVRQDTDWRPGSPWTLTLEDGRLADTGRILEADPPRRAVIEWRNEFMEELKAEGVSRCTYEIEPQDGGVVKFTVRHQSLAADSKLIEAVSGGWPSILSSLKSLLETGQPLARPQSASA